MKFANVQFLTGRGDAEMIKHNQDQIRKALLNLAMCARKECDKCQYKDRSITDLPSDECKKRSTENMNILADVCLRYSPFPMLRSKTGCYHETICWKCAKNSGLCSWSENFTPVEGWEAVPTKIQARRHSKDADEIDSYDVYECPEFELMERLKKQKKKELMK